MPTLTKSERPQVSNLIRHLKLLEMEKGTLPQTPEDNREFFKNLYSNKIEYLELTYLT
jgi:hypothetical protein